MPITTSKTKGVEFTLHTTENGESLQSVMVFDPGASPKGLSVVTTEYDNGKKVHTVREFYDGNIETVGCDGSVTPRYVPYTRAANNHTFG